MKEVIMFDPCNVTEFGGDNTLCIYHRRCWDGSVAAWIVKKAAPGAELIPTNYGEEPPWSKIRNRNVVIVDFAYPRDTLETIKSEAASLFVIDHHESARKDLEGLSFAKFDTNRSGAALTWDTFFPYLPPPMLVRYVEDYDLWRFVLPHSEEVNMALHSFDLTHRNLDKLEMMLEENPFLFAIEGKAILRYRDHIVSTICENAIELEIEGNNVLGVESPREFRDHVAGQLAHGRLFGVAFQTKTTRNGSTRSYSLRTRGSDFEVHKVAEAFEGGGGHPASAAFSVKLEGTADPFQVVDLPMLKALNKSDVPKEKV